MKCWHRFSVLEDAGIGCADDPGSCDSQVPADLLNACFEIERNRQFVADPHLRFRQAVTLQRAKPPGSRPGWTKPLCFPTLPASKSGFAGFELASRKIWVFGQLEPGKRLCDIATPAGARATKQLICCVP